MRTQFLHEISPSPAVQAESWHERDEQTSLGLHRLIYTSSAQPPGKSDCASTTSVWDIVNGAARKNVKVDITGALISVCGHFVQVLEGDAAAIETVFEKICRDVRHSALSLIDFSPAQERHFSGWSMVPIDVDSMSDPKRFELLFMSIRAGKPPRVVVREVKALLEELELDVIRFQ